ITEQHKYLSSNLPPFLYQRLIALDAAKSYNTSEYEALNKHLTSLFTVRITPMPSCVAEAFANINTTIYVAIQGESEFTIGGALEHYNITAEINKINVPTLVTNGEYDSVTRPVVEKIHSQIPNSKLITYPTSGHMTMIDAASLVLDDIRKFLIRVEKKRNIHEEF
ncbi:unnamed protein product, partial [Didymodactylos carnosus]